MACIKIIAALSPPDQMSGLFRTIKLQPQTTILSTPLPPPKKKKRFASDVPSYFIIIK